MTDYDKIQAIAVNLLRMAEWYYKDPAGSAALCERYLQQSKELSSQISEAPTESYLKKVLELSVPTNHDPADHTAEQFLTLGVILQHSQKLL